MQVPVPSEAGSIKARRTSRKRPDEISRRDWPFGAVYRHHLRSREMTKKARWPREVAGPWWVPNLDLSQATALAVPVGQRYRQAIYAKLVRLLEQAGRPAARAAVQGYLEAQEMDILPLDFPDGWAEQILSSGTMPELVAMGNPDEAEPADPELMREAVDGQGELSLEEFLGAAPS